MYESLGYSNCTKETKDHIKYGSMKQEKNLLQDSSGSISVGFS